MHKKPGSQAHFLLLWRTCRRLFFTILKNSRLVCIIQSAELKVLIPHMSSYFRRFSITGVFSFLRDMAAPLVIAGSLASCSSEVRTHGVLVEGPSLQKVVVGRSTKQDVLRAFGPPSITSLFGKQETWLYIGSQQHQYAFYKNEELERSIISVHFNSSGIVADLAESGLEDGESVAIVTRKTPTSGNDVTVLEQLIGNIGKFNTPSQNGFDGRSNLPGY